MAVEERLSKTLSLSKGTVAGCPGSSVVVLFTLNPEIAAVEDERAKTDWLLAER